MSLKIAPPAWISVTPGCCAQYGNVPVPPQLTMSTGKPAARQVSAPDVSKAMAAATTHAFSEGSAMVTAWLSRKGNTARCEQGWESQSQSSTKKEAVKYAAPSIPRLFNALYH